MLPTQTFGRTGHQSTRVIFGAAALGSMRQDSADNTLQLLESHGVNHIDTARGYGDSELRLAPWLAGNRDKVFLATKTGERDGSAARAQLEDSLSRMEVDSVDLIQLHNLVEPDEWEVAFAPGGAVAALAKARDEGLCRFIGVTGHGLRIPSMHLRSLNAFDFDSVLFPYNHSLMASDAYRADAETLLELCATRNVAVQTIKSITRAPWGDREQTASTWYEPLTDQGAIDTAVAWVLGREGLFLNTVGDITILPSVLAAAVKVTGRPEAAEMRALEDSFGLQPLFT